MAIDNERVLVLDDISLMPYELEVLNEHFPLLVDATSDFSRVESLEKAQYKVAVVDPYALTRDWRLASTLVGKVREKSRGLVLVDSGIGAEELGSTEGLRLVQGRDFDYVHAKPYNIDKLIEQIRTLASRHV